MDAYTIYLVEENQNGDCVKKYVISIKSNTEATVIESVRVNGSCLWENEIHHAKITNFVTGG